MQHAYTRVVAHRGLSGVCPENTLPSLAAAVALGVDEIEFDLWASLDGELVVCHDSTVDRTSNGTGAIGELRWAEIRSLDAGSWRSPQWSGIPFCRLEDVLDLCGSRVTMNIHLKDPGPGDLAVRRLRDEVERRGFLDTVYVAGSRPILDAARRIAPELSRCCLGSFPTGTAMLDCAIEFGCGRVQFCSPNFTEADIGRAHAEGVLCNLFYGNQPDTAEEALRRSRQGIDAILTNWANLVMPVLRADCGGVAATG